jgi:hypothetical protein
MDSPDAPKKPRSPWLYVLLGCGGLAALMCLGVTVFFLFIAKKGSDFVAGMTDPTVKVENARKQLGVIPDGYDVIASMNAFGMMEVTLLADQTTADGGIGEQARVFQFTHVMANENNKSAKAFFADGEAGGRLGSTNIHVRPEDVMKRGQLTVDGRALRYVVARGVLGGGGARRDGLHTLVLFNCPGDALSMAVWSQPDPSPGTAPEALELAGTVADEAELARFLKPVDPCGR